MLYSKMVSWPEIAFLEIYPEEWIKMCKWCQHAHSVTMCQVFCYVVDVSISHHTLLKLVVTTILISWGKRRLREGTGSKSYIDEMSRSNPNLMIICWISLPPNINLLGSTFMCVSVCLSSSFGRSWFQCYIAPLKPVWTHFTYNSLREAGSLFYVQSPTLCVKGQHNNVLKAGPWELSLTGFRVCHGGRD